MQAVSGGGKQCVREQWTVWRKKGKETNGLPDSKEIFQRECVLRFSFNYR